MQGAQKTQSKKDNAGILAPVRDSGAEIGDLGEYQATDLRHVIGVATTESLKAELARLLAFSADNLIRLAIIVTELERRGEDLSSIKFGLLPILRQIASGKLHPQIVVMFAGEPGALKRIATLPMVQQEEIVNGKRKFISTEPAEMPQTQKLRVPREPKFRKSFESDSNLPSLESVTKMASVAMPKDLGEIVAEMILKNSNPEMSLKFVLMNLRVKIGPAADKAISAALIALAGKVI